MITLALGYAGQPLVNKGTFKVDETTHAGASDVLTITARSASLAYGRPDLYPERGVTLQGWKPQIDGKGWLIDRATHAYGDNGLTTTLEMEAA